jgi:adenylosuccinate lyase
LSREEAYGVAQRNAAKSWDGEDFRTCVENDPLVKERLSAETLAHVFDIHYHLKSLKHTFEALGI